MKTPAFVTRAAARWSVLLLLCASALHVHANVNLHVSVHAYQGDVEQATATQAQAILYTRVVDDNEHCGSANGVLAMCASKNYVCRMKDGQAMFATAPMCLPFDPLAQGANTLDASATAPWETCDPDHSDVNVPTCRLSFQCMCAQMQTKSECRCVPPDAVPGRSLSGESCGKSKDGGACASNEYCKWTPDGDQICGTKPYFQ